jgi:hypothetical protein
MSGTSEIPFQTLLKSLLDESVSLNPHLLYRLSDLDTDELALLKSTWPQLPLWRRQALMENLEEMGLADDLLSFEAIGRHAITDQTLVRLEAVRLLGIRGMALILIFSNLLESDPEVDVRRPQPLHWGHLSGEIDKIPRARQFTLEDRLLHYLRR